MKKKKKKVRVVPLSKEKNKLSEVIAEMNEKDEISLEDLDETLEILKKKVKRMARKNGFSKKLKEKIETELR